MVDLPASTAVQLHRRTRAVPWETAVLVAALASVYVESATPGGITIGRLIAPVVLVSALAAWIARGARRTAPGPLVAALFYAAWAVASGLWTTSPSGTLDLVGSLAIALAFTAAFTALLLERTQLRTLLGVAAIGATMTAVVEIVGYATSPGTRGGAFIGDPNFVAAYLLVSLPLVLVLAAEARSVEERLGLRVAALAIVLGILATLSRGGLLALGVLALTVLLLPAYVLFRTRREKRRTIIATAAVVGVLLALGGAGAARFETLYHGVGTASGRQNTWSAAWREIRIHPLLGLGYGAFQRQSNELMRRTPGANLRDFELRQTGSEAHSAYVGSTVELGFPGLALFVAVLLATAASLLRTALAARAERDVFLMRAAFGLFAGLVAWAAASVSLSTETSRPLWIIVGIAAALPRLRSV